MNISKQTVAILKNFAQINNSLVVDERNILKTGIGATYGTSRPSVLAVADIPENLPDFYMYDLNKLLSSMGMFDIDELEVTFDDFYVILKQGKRTIKIPKSNPDSIPFRVKYTADKIKNPKVKYNATFSITNESIKKLRNAANIFKAQDKHLSINIEDGKGVLKVTNMENSSSDVYTETFETDPKDNGKVIIDLKDFIIIDGDYELSICDEKVVKLYNEDLSLIYQITAMKI